MYIVWDIPSRLCHFHFHVIFFFFFFAWQNFFNTDRTTGQGFLFSSSYYYYYDINNILKQIILLIFRSRVCIFPKTHHHIVFFSCIYLQCLWTPLTLPASVVFVVYCTPHRSQAIACVCARQDNWIRTRFALCRNRATVEHTTM